MKGAAPSTANMKLYFSPLACSLAANIVLRELGLSLERIEVDTRSQRTATGADYSQINPLGMVPVLLLDSGAVLTENAAVLQYLASLAPEAGLAAVQPPAALARLQQWLSFVGTELHKVVYLPLIDEFASDAARDEALRKASARLAFVEATLMGQDFLLDGFSIADAYLFAVLNWSKVTPISFSSYPAIAAYTDRIQARPAVAQALREEFELYGEQRARRKGTAARPTRDVLAAFNQVFLSRDPGGLDALIHDDCELVNVDGTRHRGKAACLALWSSLALDPAIRFELEAVRVERESAVITWSMVRGQTRVQGVNLMRLQNGRIVEARGYAQNPVA